MRYIIQKFKKLEKIEKGEASKVCLFFHSKRVMKISRGPFPLFYNPGENRLINQGFPWGCWGRGGSSWPKRSTAVGGSSKALVGGSGALGFNKISTEISIFSISPMKLRFFL